jgi:hypothetical protein
VSGFDSYQLNPFSAVSAALMLPFFTGGGDAAWGCHVGRQSLGLVEIRTSDVTASCNRILGLSVCSVRDIPHVYRIYKRLLKYDLQTSDRTV